MNVSVIIVGFNSSNLLVDCIASIYKLTSGISYEIILVDNNSSDDTVDRISRLFPDVIIIKNALNSGFGSANNMGSCSARGKYLFFLNPDTMIVNNAIKILYDFIICKSHLSIGCVGGSLYNPDMTAQISYGKFPGLGSLLYGYSMKIWRMGRKLSRFDVPGYVSQPDSFEVDYVTGADIMIKRDIFEEIGKFDEEFFLYFEETDLCSRLQRLGYINYICPAAKIIHLCGQSTPKENAKKYYLDSYKLFIIKHHGRFYASVVAFVMRIGSIISRR